MGFSAPYHRPKYGYGASGMPKKSRYGVSIKLANGSHFHADFTEPPTEEMINKARQDMEKIIKEMKESK